MPLKKNVSLPMGNLVNVCTDGAPAMVGKSGGFVALLSKELKHPEKLIQFHCIIHQQSLCAKSTKLNDTLAKSVTMVNYIRANGLRHRQFREALRVDEE